jgi:hypothetical protein
LTPFLQTASVFILWRYCWDKLGKTYFLQKFNTDRVKTQKLSEESVFRTKWINQFKYHLLSSLRYFYPFHNIWAY